MIQRAKIIGEDRDHLKFFCPGCHTVHVVLIKQRGTASPWEWNGDLERPTLSPSVLVYSHETLNAAGKALIDAAGDGPTPELTDEHRVSTPQCHSYVRDGHIEFLNDSTHALAGTTVELGPHSPVTLR